MGAGHYETPDEFLDEFHLNDPESRERIKEGARRLEEAEEIYALDIEGLEWKRLGDPDDPRAPEIADLPKGGKALRSAFDPATVLRYTRAEWVAFVKGAKDGEFNMKPESCGVHYGTGQSREEGPAALNCERRKGHPEYMVDGVGHWAEGDLHLKQNPDEEMR